MRSAATGARYHESMPNIGPLEIIVLLIIALIVFGPKRLPELGRSLGRGIREFRGSIGGDDRDEEQPSRPDEIETGTAEGAAKEEPVAHKRP